MRATLGITLAVSIATNAFIMPAQATQSDPLQALYIISWRAR